MDEGLPLPVSIPKSHGVITQELREDYIRWIMNAMIEANLKISQEKMFGTEYNGPRTMQDFLATPGPGGLTPEYTTVHSWLRAPWARPILAQVRQEMDQVCGVETEAQWPLIMANIRHQAMTAKGRDAVMAAKFIDEQRQRGPQDEGSSLGKKIAELIGSGRFDGEVEVRERVVRLRRQQTVDEPKITVIEG